MIKPIISPIILFGWFVCWTRLEGVPGHVNFQMLGDHGFYCPIDYGDA